MHLGYRKLFFEKKKEQNYSVFVSDICRFTERWRLTHPVHDAVSNTMTCVVCQKYAKNKRDTVNNPSVIGTNFVLLLSMKYTYFMMSNSEVTLLNTNFSVITFYLFF